MTHGPTHLAAGDPAAATRAPAVRDHRLEGRDGEPLVVRGRLLGYGTSHRDEHSHPVERVRAFGERAGPPDRSPRWADPGERCSACRWFEVRLLAVEAELVTDHLPEPARGRYLVLTQGLTAVPGETAKRRAEWTDSPHEVIELLVQRGPAGRSIPLPSRRALAQAATWDEDVARAFHAATGRAAA